MLSNTLHCLARDQTATLEMVKRLAAMMKPQLHLLHLTNDTLKLKTIQSDNLLVSMECLYYGTDTNSDVANIL